MLLITIKNAAPDLLGLQGLLNTGDQKIELTIVIFL